MWGWGTPYGGRGGHIWRAEGWGAHHMEGGVGTHHMEGGVGHTSYGEQTYYVLRRGGAHIIWKAHILCPKEGWGTHHMEGGVGHIIEGGVGHIMWG
jgi:hypothetical protein